MCKGSIRICQQLDKALGIVVQLRLYAVRAAARIAECPARPLRPVLQGIVGVVPSAPEFRYFLAADAPVKGGSKQFPGAGVSKFKFRRYFPDSRLLAGCSIPDD
jgi:hypothetical protein